MNVKTLWKKNPREYYSVDGSFRIQYFIDRRGLSAWIISTRLPDGFYVAVNQASTFDNARAKYFELLKEVA
jgi:hypothetical protein